MKKSELRQIIREEISKIKSLNENYEIKREVIEGAPTVTLMLDQGTWSKISHLFNNFGAAFMIGWEKKGEVAYPKKGSGLENIQDFARREWTLQAYKVGDEISIFGELGNYSFGHGPRTFLAKSARTNINAGKYILNKFINNYLEPILRGEEPEPTEVKEVEHMGDWNMADFPGPVKKASIQFLNTPEGRKAVQLFKKLVSNEFDAFDLRDAIKAGKFKSMNDFRFAASKGGLKLRALGNLDNQGNGDFEVMNNNYTSKGAAIAFLDDEFYSVG